MFLAGWSDRVVSSRDATEGADMSEPFRPERGPASGKYCVWVETDDGDARKVFDDFDAEEDAIATMNTVAQSVGASPNITRVLVYGHGGEPIQWLDRR